MALKLLQCIEEEESVECLHVGVFRWVREVSSGDAESENENKRPVSSPVSVPLGWRNQDRD